MNNQKNYRLDDHAIAYISNYQEEHFCPTQTDALTQIILEHEATFTDHSAEIWQQQAERISEQVILYLQTELKLPETLTRIRLGTNNADRNSEIILLLLNSLLEYSGHFALIEPDTPQMKDAREVVSERIENYRQKALERKKLEAARKEES
ncbi:MAG: hypothetical protein RSC76_08945 [Oscillospiraceae bacterium]